MMVLCILLAMLSLFLSLKLIYQRKLVQKVKKQIDFLIDRDTQTEIMVEKTDVTIQDLAASINHLLKKYRSMGQEIERSDTLFRDTITSLSHDLRTPLATANGYIQLLQEQDLTGEQKEYATIAGERISAVKLLLDQLFEFVRIEADELKLNCRNTDIHSVLRDVVASYYGDFEQKKCVPYLTIFPDFSYKINAFSSGKSTFNKINMISSLFKISLAFCNDKRNKHLSLKPDIFHHLIFVIFNNQFTLLSFKLY